MASVNRTASVGGRFAIVLIVTVLLAGSASTRRGGASATPVTTTPMVAGAAHSAAVPLAVMKHAARLPVPAALAATGLNLRAAPVPVPLVLQIPSIGVNVPVIGVGLTPTNVMDAPEGRASNPVWQQAFWYRGSAIPGVASTALIAGHIDDPLGRLGSFGRIRELRRGDVITVHDTRTGLNVRFAVVASKAYSLAQTTDPSVLTGMYGSGPVAGRKPQHSTDGLAHLTLVTCAGVFDHTLGTHDQRLAVFATRIA
jgi:sortase (surface protein transpeptidase)